MQLFSDGIAITDIEHKCLLHIVRDPEAWLMAALIEKAQLRRAALIHEWRPRLSADPVVTELPADGHGLCDLIMGRSDYQTRLEQDAAQDPPIPIYRYNVARYESVDRSGSTITLFSSGINLGDDDCGCILAYVQDISDWLLGALLGQINRGKKLMIRDWHPIILADSDIAMMPVSENGLINMIVNRPDYHGQNAAAYVTVPLPVP